MRRKSFAEMECPVARTLEVMGEWWSMLIIRDAFHGVRRFEAFQARLGIARNMLTRRLAALIDAGILEKRPYSAHPPRFEYRLTAKGRDLFPVLITLMNWGNRWAAPRKGPVVRLVHRTTGDEVAPILADAASGKALGPHDVTLAEGPGAGPETRAAVRHLRELRRAREKRTQAGIGGLVRRSAR
jgi:DNA-binding HxlR family transcriptional regulator